MINAKYQQQGHVSYVTHMIDIVNIDMNDFLFPFFWNNWFITSLVLGHSQEFGLTLDINNNYKTLSSLTLPFLGTIANNFCLLSFTLHKIFPQVILHIMYIH